MSKGIVYLIQPLELIGTSKYKIGCSKFPNLNRCINGYKRGSRYICIIECNNPIILEKNIKVEFNKIFKLIAGNEYFEGTENIMLELFLKTIKEYKITDEINTYNSEQIYEISTYEDYLLSSNIRKIIITNTILNCGYILYKGINQIWYEINKEETLLGCLNHDTYDSMVLNTNTNQLYKFDINQSNQDYKHITIKYNYDLIINDICKKCYNKNVKLYVPKYHEYCILNYNMENYILDTKKLTVTGIDCYDIFTTDVWLSNSRFYFDNFENINVDIIDNLLNALINDKNILIKYKKLCYNILVEQKEEIIFYDYCVDGYQVLGNVLKKILTNIASIHKNYQEDFDDDCQVITKNKPRVVFIDGTIITDKQIETKITKVKNLGIKNIVIKTNKIKNMYDQKSKALSILDIKRTSSFYMYNHKSFIEYVDNNKMLIINNVFDKELVKQYLSGKNFHKVFKKRELLFINYLKWCCSL